MCYELYLSTSSSQDLSKYNSELVCFVRPKHLNESAAQILQNAERWFVGSKSRCSCTFRHLAGGDLSFDEPQDWCPEEKEEVQATIELYRVIAALVHAGSQVDCLGIWLRLEQREIKTMSVSLSTVPEKAFRFFEDYHFVFQP